ncbi:unnamed protein product [Calypogeia fissa]
MTTATERTNRPIIDGGLQCIGGVKLGHQVCATAETANKTTTADSHAMALALKQRITRHPPNKVDGELAVGSVVAREDGHQLEEVAEVDDSRLGVLITSNDKRMIYPIKHVAEWRVLDVKEVRIERGKVLAAFAKETKFDQKPVVPDMPLLVSLLYYIAPKEFKWKPWRFSLDDDVWTKLAMVIVQCQHNGDVHSWVIGIIVDVDD